MVAKSPVLSKADFEKLRQIDTCTVSNAIERLKARLRNEGQISGAAIHCMFPDLPPVLGYAVTGSMRSTTAPVAGRAYHENMHWWRFVESIPEPRIMVVEDRDNDPGAGALFGELHTVIGQALHCVAYVSNGSVRDLPAIHAAGFQLFAGRIEVSHKYAHISEFGKPVEIGGLKIVPGELLHGDLHGMHTIPISIAARIPEVAEEIMREEDELKKLCRSPHFSLKKLDEKLQHLPGDGFEVPLDGY
jgi:regulator of RNase E activity RraA